MPRVDPLARPDWTIWLNYGACRLCLRSLGSMMNMGRCSSALLSAPGATPAPSPKPPCLSLVPLVHVLNEVFSKHQALSLPPHHPNETAPLISSPGHHSPQQTLRGGDNKTIIFSSMHWLIFCRKKIMLNHALTTGVLLMSSAFEPFH